MITIKYKNIIKKISFLAIILVLNGCNSILTNTNGTISSEQKKLIIITIMLISLIIIPVILMTIIFSKKYNASNATLKYSPDLYDSKKIEFFSWIVPVFIIFVLSIITWKTTHTLDPYKEINNGKKPITIQVISLNWKWMFIYPENNIATFNEIVIPINTPINFKITSESIMNSFFIPSLGSQIYAMPGMQTKLHLVANKSGIYKGFSSSYSGEGFSNMKFNVITVPNLNYFNKWIAKVKSSNNKIQYHQINKIKNNNNVVYFSTIEKNLYKKIVSRFNHMN